MKYLWIVAVMLGLACSADAADTVSQPKLTLDQAIELAITHSPNIKGADAVYGMAKGARRQASALPNPSIGFEAENVAGTGAYGGADNAELTLGLNQQIQIGGKRSARIGAADTGKVIARYGQSTARLELIQNVEIAFADAVAAQEQSMVAQKQAKLAKDVYKTVDKRVSAAAEPLVQRNKAKILLANAELAADRAESQKDAAFRGLSTLWNNAKAPSVLSTDEFYKADKPKLGKDIEALLKETPDYRQQSANVEQAKSLLDLEKANAIPDPTVSFGVRDFRSTNDQVLIVGLSLPLPVFNVNRGNIEKARYQSVKADTDRQRLLLDGQAALAEQSQIVQNAWLTASRIKKDILPEAQEAFRQAQRGYNAGKFAYLEVLDAQRTLTDTRTAYIQALRDYHVSQAQVERLTAQHETPVKEVQK